MQGGKGRVCRYHKIIDYFKAQKKKNVAETAKAKEEIINGIKEYDAMHSEEEGGNEDE